MIILWIPLLVTFASLFAALFTSLTPSSFPFLSRHFWYLFIIIINFRFCFLIFIFRFFVIFKLFIIFINFANIAWHHIFKDSFSHFHMTKFFYSRFGSYFRIETARFS